MSRSALLLPLLLAAGCVYIPTPSHGHLGGHGAIGEEEASALVPGRTNREAVLFRLGEPDATLLADRLFVYTWQEIRGYIIAQGSGPVPARRTFLVLFDDAGYVLRTGQADPGFFGDMLEGGRVTPLARAAEDWATDQDPVRP
jgi:hypothetical protein